MLGQRPTTEAACPWPEELCGTDDSSIVRLRLYFDPNNRLPNVWFFKRAAWAAVFHILREPSYSFYGILGDGVEALQRPGGGFKCIQISLLSKLPSSKVAAAPTILAPRGIINDGLMTLLPTSSCPFPMTAVMFLGNSQQPLFHRALLTNVPSQISLDCSRLHARGFAAGLFPAHKLMEVAPYVDDNGFRHADKLSIILQPLSTSMSPVPCEVRVKPFAPMQVLLRLPYLPTVAASPPSHAPPGPPPSPSPPPPPHAPSGAPGAPPSPPPPSPQPPPPSSSSAPQPATPATFKDAVRGTAASTSGRVAPLAVCPAAVVDSGGRMLTDPISGHKRSAPSASLSSAKGSVCAGDAISLIFEGTNMQQPG